MIEFHRLARNELREAARWYRLRSPQVAERFVAQVERAVERVANDPDSHPLIGRGHRMIRVSRFPYLLVYQSVTTDRIVITAVAHTSRRPGYWRNRR